MERPYVPFYKPYGMTDEEYEYEVRIAEQRLDKWEAEIEALQQADVVGRSEQLSCPRCRHTGIDTDKDGLSYCRGCSHYWRAT